MRINTNILNAIDSLAVLVIPIAKIAAIMKLFLFKEIVMLIVTEMCDIKIYLASTVRIGFMGIAYCTDMYNKYQEISFDSDVNYIHQGLLLLRNEMRVSNHSILHLLSYLLV